MMLSLWGGAPTAKCITQEIDSVSRNQNDDLEGWAGKPNDDS